MENKVIIGTARSGHVRLYLGDTTKLCEDARKLHDLWPTSLAALGRSMSITGIMGLMQKEEGEVVTTNINGGGPIGSVLTVADSDGNVKGFVGDSHIYLKYNDSNKLAVGMGVGKDGTLSVTKNLKLKQNYTSEVALQSGEIGDDYAYYFMASEQIPAIVSVGVLVETDYSCKSAGVLLIELLPDHTEEDIVMLEELLKTLKPVSTIILEEKDLLDFARKLFPDFELLEERELRYHCDCSRERFLRNLLTLPKKDLLEVLEEDKIDIRCDFCEKVYTFDKNDLDLVKKYVSDR